MVTQVHGESVVDAAAGNDTNVNHIMERFQRTGFLPPAAREGQFADVSNLGDLTDTMVRTQEAILAAENAAEEAPAHDPEEPEGDAPRNQGSGETGSETAQDSTQTTSPPGAA